MGRKIGWLFFTYLLSAEANLILGNVWACFKLSPSHLSHWVANFGSVHTNTFSYENAYIYMRFRLPSIHNTIENGANWKRSVLNMGFENGASWKRISLDATFVWSCQHEGWLDSKIYLTQHRCIVVPALKRKFWRSYDRNFISQCSDIVCRNEVNVDKERLVWWRQRGLLSTGCIVILRIILNED